MAERIIKVDRDSEIPYELVSIDGQLAVRALVEDKKPEVVVEDKKPEVVVEDKKPEVVVEDKKPIIKKKK